MASKMSSDELALLWVCLGLLWLWGPLAGEKRGSDWLCLGLFGFAFGAAEGGFFVVTICGERG
jgi:hypothetical protein